MANAHQNIKIVEGNTFALVLPLVSRTYTLDGSPVDEAIDLSQLQDVKVMIGNTEYPYTTEEEGVQVIDNGTLKQGTYNVVLTATYYGSQLRAAWFELVTIVAWNMQSDADQYLQGSPIICEAAVVLSGALTDAELEALKEEYREKNAQLAQAIADAEAAKREWEEKAADLDGVAQEETLTQGVADIRDDISHIDIDTTTLAKETSVKDGNDTAISVGKEIRSEVGTGSDTAAETGTLFAIVKWVKDRVKSIANYVGTPASGQPSDLFAAIAACGGGDVYAMNGEVLEGKSDIADAIVTKGGVADDSMTFAQLSAAILALNYPYGLIISRIDVVSRIDYDILDFSAIAEYTGTSLSVGGTYIQKIYNLPPTPNLTSLSVSGASVLEELDFGRISHTEVLLFANFLNGFTLLKKVNFIPIYMGDGVFYSNFCRSAPIEDVVWGKSYEEICTPTQSNPDGIGALNNYDQNRGGSEFMLSRGLLNRASLRALLNGLKDMTGQTTLTYFMGAVALAKLSDDDIAVATRKNWTLA